MPRLSPWFALFLGALAVVGVRAANLDIRVVDSKGAPVADAVVWLVSLDAQPAAAERTAGDGISEIEQRGQEFAPYVTVIRTGMAIRLPNRDTVEHHVYSDSPTKRFQFPLYAPGKAETVVFDRPGIVPLGCNIHDWMLAYVVVVDTPWYIRTSAEGTATLKGVPPGRYHAEIWHPRLPKNEHREVAIGAEDSATSLALTLTLKPDRRIHRMLDNGRAGYR